MVNVGQIRSIKSAHEAISDLDEQISKLKDVRSKVLDKLTKLESQRKFKFPCGLSVPYKEMTLILKYYIERGTGYEDDSVNFGEYMFFHPDATRNVRFLSEESMELYNIPRKTINHYGKPQVRQTDIGHSSGYFCDKFKNVVSINPDDRAGPNHWMLTKGFVNYV